MCRAGICGARCVAVSAGDASSAAAGQKTRRCASLKRAADQGDVEAQFALGTMHYKGDGVPQDFKRAAVLFKLAADQGHAGAQIASSRRTYDRMGSECVVPGQEQLSYGSEIQLYGVERFFLCCATPARGAGLVHGLVS